MSKTKFIWKTWKHMWNESDVKILLTGMFAQFLFEKHWNLFSCNPLGNFILAVFSGNYLLAFRKFRKDCTIKKLKLLESEFGCLEKVIKYTANSITLTMKKW